MAVTLLQGLEDQMILIPSGTSPQIVAGEIDIGLLNGSSAMAAALQGADLKVIGNAGNKMDLLYTRSTRDQNHRSSS